MLRYVLQRLLLAVPVFLGVLTVVFLVIRVLPGDPATAALGDYASQQAVDALRERLGLHQPLPVQYVQFLAAVLRGDLGRSMINGAPVADQVGANLPYTLELTGAALLLGVALGIPTGMYTAARRNRLPDYIGRVLSLAGLSAPAFVLGVLLALLFAVQLHWLPAVSGGPGDRLASLALPALTLGLVMTSSVARLARAAMLEVLGQDYVRTARAKGLAERTVVGGHALRSALIPIVSLTGFWGIALIGDSVTTELVFARPGLGKLMVGAMLQKDYTTIQSVMVVYTAFVVGINLLTDLAYGVVDPRVRR